MPVISTIIIVTLSSCIGVSLVGTEIKKFIDKKKRRQFHQLIIEECIDPEEFDEPKNNLNVNIKKIKNTFVINNKNNNGKKCIFCDKYYENKAECSELHCGHKYHFDCIIDWLVFNDKCPKCNE